MSGIRRHAPVCIGRLNIFPALLLVTNTSTVVMVMIKVVVLNTMPVWQALKRRMDNTSVVISSVTSLLSLACALQS